MTNFVIFWAVVAFIAFLAGAVGAIICYYTRDDWSDKRARHLTRNWCYVMALGVIWPIGLPLLLGWHINKAVRYAFPRESEE